MKKYFSKLFMLTLMALVNATAWADAPDLSAYTKGAEIDFSKMSATSITLGDKFDGNNTFSYVTSPEELNECIVLQPGGENSGNGWRFYGGNLRAWNGTRGGAVLGLSKNDVVVAKSSGITFGGQKGAECSIVEDGGLNYITMSADGFLGFSGGKNATISTITIYKAGSAQTAKYTVNYLIENTTTAIQSASTLEGIVGATPTISTNPIYTDGKKYIYRSSDVKDKTIASDGSTVVNVYFYEAATYTVTLTNNINSKTIEASGFEGDNIDVAYPTYQLVDGTLYSAGKLSGDGKGYYMTINLSENGVTKNIEYTATDISKVKHLIEVEHVPGAAICGNGNTKIRSSFGGSGYASGEDLKLVTLSPAKYKIKAVVCDASSNNPSAVFNFKVADQVVFSTTPGAVNWAESTSAVFEVNQVSVLKLAADNGNTNRGIDFIYVTYEGEAENVIEAPHFKLTSPEEGKYDIMDAEISNEVNQALTEFSIEFPEGNVITASESVKAQMKDANGNVLYEGTPSATGEDNLGAIKMDGHITKAGTYTLVAPAGLFILNGETLSDEQTFSFVIEGELPLGYYDNVAEIKNNMVYAVYPDPSNENTAFIKYTAKYDGTVSLAYDNWSSSNTVVVSEKNFVKDDPNAELVKAETELAVSTFTAEKNKTYYIQVKTEETGSAIVFNVNFKLAAFDDLEDGPYYDVDSLLLEAKVRLMELDEMYNDETRENLGLTQAWSRINDLIAHEELMLAADKANSPKPSLAKLAGHYSRILAIEAAMSSFVVAAENVHPIDVFELYKDVIANINYTQDAIKQLIGDEPLIESLAALWNELLSRINKSDDDIRALQAKPNPTDDEIAALDEELNTLAKDLEDFLALLNGDATGINNATANKNANAAVYNMAGQQVNAQFKGIVIKNGKKVVVK